MAQQGSRGIFQVGALLMNGGIGITTGSGAPTSGASGTGAGKFGPGTIYYDATTGNEYVNFGTKASPTWTLVRNASATSGVVTGTITSANITGTSAGQLGHANGVILVPAGGTHIINELVYCMLINAFSVAAYTGGGNTTINIGGGGAALTGLISAANFIQSGANKIIEFTPLAAAPNVYTENNSINLVSASAPTQPGTAAGVFRYFVGYRAIATGL